MSTLLVESQPQPEQDLSAEQFWLMWGGESGLTIEQFSLIWDDSRSWYVDLPFHNFTHACETLWEAMRLADLCQENGVSINRKALIVGALFHDAGYDQDHAEIGFDDKETYSAAIVGMKADKYGLDVDDLFTVQNAILATKRGSHVHSKEDIVLRRADLKNIAGNYAEDFLRKTQLLHKETERLSGKKISVWDFATTSIAILSEYLDDNLSLGEFDEAKNRQTVFQLNAIANLTDLAREIAQYKNEKVVDLVKRLGTHVMRVLGITQDT